jgi:hypothetical protein
MGRFIHTREDFGQCARFDFLYIAAMTYSEVRAERKKEIGTGHGKIQRGHKVNPEAACFGTWKRQDGCCDG